MLLPTLYAHTHSGSRPVMAVSDIEGVHLMKGLIDGADFLCVRYFPASMTDPVLRGEVKQSRARLYVRHNFFQALLIPVSQENRAGLGVADVHVTHTIFFLLPTGILMLLDHTVQIIVNGSAGHDTGLTAAVHGQLIKIITGLVVLHEITVLYHAPEQLFCFLINLRCIDICLFGKLSLRAVDTKEGQGLSLYGLSCLFPIVYIIGKRRDICLFSGCGPDAAKSSDLCH